MLVQNSQVQCGLHLFIKFTSDQRIWVHVILDFFDIIVDHRLKEFKDFLVSIVTVIDNIIVELVIQTLAQLAWSQSLQLFFSFLLVFDLPLVGLFKFVYLTLWRQDSGLIVPLKLWIIFHKDGTLIQSIKISCLSQIALPFAISLIKFRRCTFSTHCGVVFDIRLMYLRSRELKHLDQ